MKATQQRTAKKIKFKVYIVQNLWYTILGYDRPNSLKDHLNPSPNKKIIKSNMEIGDRVRIQESVIVYHHPQHKKQPFDLKGMEGEIIDIVTNWEGRPVSANLPILVKFEKRFKAHFRDNEVEIVK